MERIENYVQRRVEIVQEEVPAREVARTMRDQRTPAVLVVDREGHLTGIVTERDFVARLVADGLSLEIPISSLMSPGPVCITEDAPVEMAVRELERFGLDRLPVLGPMVGDGASRVVGWITLEDLVVGGALELSRVPRLTRRKMMQRQAAARGGPEDPQGGVPDAERSEQVLKNFHHRVAALADLTMDSVPELTNFLLGALCRRITFSAALHLIAQLPRALQEVLLQLPSGPDRDITARAVVEELIFRFGFTESYAWSVARHFYSAVTELLGRPLMKHVEAQLPPDFRALLRNHLDEPPAETPSPRLMRLGGEDRRQSARLQLESPVFTSGQEIPARYTQEGENVSPPLSWSGVPAATREFALICEDPDAPARQPWVHWVVFGIGPNQTSLPEGIPAGDRFELPVRLQQGRNSQGELGYQGPNHAKAKRHDVHRYFFKLFALDSEVVLPKGATKEELLLAISGHILARATLVGFYSRGQREKTA